MEKRGLVILDCAADNIQVKGLMMMMMNWMAGPGTLGEGGRYTSEWRGELYGEKKKSEEKK